MRALSGHAPEEQLRRKIVLLVDNNSVDKPHRDRALKTIADFVETDFSETAEWSVVAVGSQLDTVQPFTTEKGEVSAALLKVRKMPTLEANREIDRRLMSDPVRARLRESEFESFYDFGEAARYQGREQTMRNMLATIAAARAVIKTCRAYSAASGRKVLVLVTGGLELNTSFNAFDDSKDRQTSQRSGRNRDHH